MPRIAVLGSGMAGFGAVHRLFTEGITADLYEQKPYHGGHTASFKFEGGFTFDEGPHISFTKNERLQKLFAESVNQDYQTLTSYVNNYWRGHWIKHPAICNLHGLPSNLVVHVIKDFVEAHTSKRDNTFANYADWLFAAYGRTYAELFPIQYGLKYHTTAAANMSTDWLGPRLYEASLDEVLRGALMPATADVHYVSHFRYPTHNGFVSYLNRFLNEARLHLSHRLVQFDPARRELRFSNGHVERFDHVISSIPLPELIKTIVDAPPDVLEAAGRLACSQLVVVNVAVNRPNIIDAHWTYFYDDDICFTRISTPHMQSPNNVPPGAGSLQVELYFSKKYRPMEGKPDDYIGPALRDLKRVGLLHDEDKILLANTFYVPYANVIFDLDRAKALATVHGYLEDIGVAWCGRYGDWAYIWTDEAFLSGEGAAETVLSRSTRSRRP